MQSGVGIVKSGLSDTSNLSDFLRFYLLLLLALHTFCYAVLSALLEISGSPAGVCHKKISFKLALWIGFFLPESGKASDNTVCILLAQMIR